MSRLIDADKLIQEMSEWYWDKEKQKAAENDVSPMDLFTHRAITTVQEQPTAFDLDKVVEQLKDEQELSYADFEIYAEEHGLSEDDDWHYRGLGRAVEIVKRGGVDGKIN